MEKGKQEEYVSRILGLMESLHELCIIPDLLANLGGVVEERTFNLSKMGIVAKEKGDEEAAHDIAKKIFYLAAFPYVLSSLEKGAKEINEKLDAHLHD